MRVVASFKSKTKNYKPLALAERKAFADKVHRVKKALFKKKVDTTRVSINAVSSHPLRKYLSSIGAHAS